MHIHNMQIRNTHARNGTGKVTTVVLSALLFFALFALVPFALFALVFFAPFALLLFAALVVVG